MAVLQVNHISIFCMRLYISGESYVKYTCMIGWEYNHIILLDHASFSLVKYAASFEYIIAELINYYATQDSRNQ